MMDASPAPLVMNTGGELVYAIGDIHGCYELMKDLLAQIAADAPDHAHRRRPIVVFLGDYVDRGPESSKVMDALVWLQRRADINVRLLKGNHEQALLAFLDEPEHGPPWIEFGGAQTLLAYGVPPPARGDPPAIYRQARDELLERMPASHLKLLQELELMVVIGDYAFVHAGIRPGAPLDEQAEHDLLWIRGGFLDQPGPFGKMIVHGHSWLGERPQMEAHRLGLDTGAFATGVLTAARLDDGEVGILQARRADVWAPQPAAA